MKKSLLLCAMLLAGCFSGGCALFCDVAEFRDLKQPVVQYRAFQEGVALHVAGAVARSEGSAVESIRQLKDGRTIHIEVLVSPFERDNTGTGFQTDVGMCGDYNSVIGMSVASALPRFTGAQQRLEPAEGAGTFCAVVADIDDKTGKCLDIFPVRIGAHLQNTHKLD